MKGRRTSEEPFIGLEGTCLGDFWRWGYSDLMDNTVRPVLAEFIVGSLLGVESKGRVAWDAADLLYCDHHIEVKSAGYLQSWSQQGPSRIVFDIARKRAWEATSNTQASIPSRYAECYVFCLLFHQNPTTVNPLDLGNWRFWVLATEAINDTLGDQKTLSLSRLEGLTRAVAAQQLRTEVDEKLRLDSEAPCSGAYEPA